MFLSKDVINLIRWYNKQEHMFYKTNEMSVMLQL